MKVWITQYALTTGIQEFEAEITATCPTMIEVPAQKYAPYYHKPYWHTSREEAVTHAEELRKKKLASLRRTIAKLESLNFAP
jgi:hypothetical protein